MRKGRNRIAPTEKILMETDEKIKKLEGETMKKLEIGLKAQAYDKIYKLFMEDS